MITILSPLQTKVFKILSEKKIMKDFYLSGGTALSEYYLQHRESEDFDFFTDAKTIDINNLLKTISEIKQIIESKNVIKKKIYDRNIFIFQTEKEELKIEFTLYPFKNLDKRIKKENLLIDSFRDIVANKLMTLLDRFDPKDFVDLFFIMKKIPLNKIRADCEKKFEVKVPALYIGSEFMKVKRITALPKMKKQLTIQELKDFFLKESLNLKNQIFTSEK